MHPFLPPLMVATACLMATPALAEVWRCERAGRVEFSDVPCPADGQALPERRLQPNVLQAPPPRPGSPAGNGDGNANAPANAGAPRDAAAANVCPDDAELRNMETQANSATLGRPERSFLQDEVRRARQCRKGQGRYEAADWQISRDAQRAQNNLSGAAQARARAEGMHSAADPQEGERIAERRAREDSGRRRRVDEADRRYSPPRPGATTPPAVPTVPAWRE